MKKLLLSLLIFFGIQVVYASSSTDTTLKTVINVSQIGNSNVAVSSCASRTGAFGHSCGDWANNDGTITYEQSISKSHSFLPSVEILQGSHTVTLDGTCKTGPYKLKSVFNIGNVVQNKIFEVSDSIKNPGDGKTHQFSMDLIGNGWGDFKATNCAYDEVKKPTLVKATITMSGDDDNGLISKWGACISSSSDSAPETCSSLITGMGKESISSEGEENLNDNTKVEESFVPAIQFTGSPSELANIHINFSDTCATGKYAMHMESYDSNPEAKFLVLNTPIKTPQLSSQPMNDFSAKLTYTGMSHNNSDITYNYILSGCKYTQSN